MKKLNLVLTELTTWLRPRSTSLLNYVQPMSTTFLVLVFVHGCFEKPKLVRQTLSMIVKVVKNTFNLCFNDKLSDSRLEWSPKGFIRSYDTLRLAFWFKRSPTPLLAMLWSPFSPFASNNKPSTNTSSFSSDGITMIYFSHKFFANLFFI